MAGSAQALQTKLFSRLGLDATARTTRNGRVQKRRGQASRPQRGPDNRLPKASREFSSENEDRIKLSLKRKRMGDGHVPRAKHPSLRRSSEPEGDSADDIVDEDDDHRHNNDDEDNDDDVDEEDDVDDGDMDTSQNIESRTGSSRRSDVLLSREDAHIAELERKLGIKKGSKRGPKTLEDDGLADLIIGEDEDDDDSDAAARAPPTSSKDAEWLAEKRAKRRLLGFAVLPDNSMAATTEVGERASHSARENPYTAPISVGSGTYVPPSRRVINGSNPEGTATLRRQIQGQINRLTEDNMLSIVRAIEELYQQNSRHDVASTVVEVLMAQVCKPETLPEAFFILHGGFVSALYKHSGASFGSQLLTRIVTEINHELDKAYMPGEAIIVRKESSNLFTLLSTLYVFEVVSYGIVFEYLNILLGNLSDLSAELTLRIIRMAGRLLRKDDPAALKAAIATLNKTVVASGDESALSVRTKYMIEAVNELSTGRAKASDNDAALVSEQVQRMKKRLGELKAQSSKRLDGTTAMRLSLSDIQEADSAGRWWLVGASVPVKKTGPTSRTDLRTGSAPKSKKLPFIEEDMDHLLPDYRRRAREQGLTTGAQTSIFTAIMSAADAKQGYQQFVALGLKSNERREIARVLVQCAGSEVTYNPYYALVARQACSQDSKIRFAFQDTLWSIFRRLGEPMFGEDSDRDDLDGHGDDERMLSSVGTLIGVLVLDSSLSVTILKPLDLHGLSPSTRTLVGHLLVTVLKACAKVEASEGELLIERVFGSARESSTLTSGLHYMLGNLSRSVLPKSKKLREGVSQMAVTAQEVVLSESF